MPSSHEHLRHVRVRLVVVAAIVAAGLCVQKGSAGGFQVNEYAARSIGKAGASVASADDASALFVNPGILGFLKGTHLSFGATVILPEHKFTGVLPDQATTKMQSQVLFPPTFSLTHTLENGVGFGVMASQPYALKTEWDQNWVGRSIGTKSELRTLVLSPSVAVRVSPAVSIGISLNVALSRLQLTRRIGFDSVGVPDGTSSLLGDSRLAYGVQLGIIIHPDAAWSIAAAYKSRFTIHVDDGSATFADIPPGEQGRYRDGKVSASIRTPDNLVIGMCVRPIENLTLEADVQHVFWSAFKELPILFENPETPDIVRQENWRNTTAGRIGAELTIADLALRGGFLVDQSPVPDEYLTPSMPDADRIGYSGGIGYTIGDKLRLDFAFMRMLLKKRIVTTSQVEVITSPGGPSRAFNGTYESSVTVLGLTLCYSWN